MTNETSKCVCHINYRFAPPASRMNQHIADDRVRGCIEDGRGHEEDGRAGDPEQVVGPGDGESAGKRRGAYTEGLNCNNRPVYCVPP